MMIANPIYDVVFKYLMDDNKVARFIVSRILGKEVVALEPRPQEVIGHLAQKSLTVYRLDYAATVRLEDGSEKLVIIEIQKAKYHTDILRFRKYLGEQYANDANTRLAGEDPLGREILEPLPIVSIYFLGHRLDSLTNPVIAVERTYRDAITGEPLMGRDSFVEGLTHDSFIIQIPYLSQRRRNDLETMLSIFDQANRSSDHHILNVMPDQFPKKFQSLIRRLQMAHSEPEVVNVMRLEDDVLEELQENERALERSKAKLAKQEQLVAENQLILQKKEQLIQEAIGMIQEKEGLIQEKDGVIQEKEGLIQEKDGVIQEKEGLIQEKDGVIQEKDGLIQEKDGVIQEKDGLIQKKDQALERAKRVLLARGMSEAEIQEMLA